MFDLQNRVAVCIGATSGIGRALAIGLARNGASVVPSGRRSQELCNVCREIATLGRETIPVTSDVRDRKSLEHLRDSVLARFGRVDILVNAAGYTFRQASATIGDDQWSALMDTNVTGVLRACQVFYQPLRATGGGRIVNIASLGAYAAFHEVAAYCASKAAVLSLTKSLAVEWAKDGISVNAIAPGVIPTELNNAIVTGTPRGEELLMRTPMGRFGEANELVGAALLLASSGASYLTGQCIAVDGGYLASGVNC
jgi:NAD(P)-dependent dehydrogenase (short-subunit alcohol dehydrogenase family)